MASDSRWNYTPEERKEEIVTALETYLRSHPGDLTDMQKLFLQGAISNTYRGLFGLAAQDVFDLHDDAAKRPPVPAAMVEGLTRQRLERALEVLKHSPAQTPPVFR